MSISGAWGDPRLKTGEKEGKGRGRKEEEDESREGAGFWAQSTAGAGRSLTGEWPLPGEDTQHRWCRV